MSEQEQWHETWAEETKTSAATRPDTEPDFAVFSAELDNVYMAGASAVIAIRSELAAERLARSEDCRDVTFALEHVTNQLAALSAKHTALRNRVMDIARDLDGAVPRSVVNDAMTRLQMLAEELRRD